MYRKFEKHVQSHLLNANAYIWKEYLLLWCCIIYCKLITFVLQALTSIMSGYYHEWHMEP